VSAVEREDRDPGAPNEELLDRYGARFLDPDDAVIVDGVPEPRPTAYVSRRLLVSTRVDRKAVLKRLESAAKELGWAIDAADEETCSTVKRRRKGEEHTLGVARVALRPGKGTASAPPDGWALLQRARAKHGVEAMEGVGLDHLLFATAEVGPAPHHDSNPYFEDSPHHDSNPVGAIASYGRPGSGGRQPVAVVVPRPHRARRLATRRPVVAILDTGCSVHPWLADVVREDVTLDDVPIGYIDPDTDPESHGDLTGPLDGAIDALAGHGTFIAGLVHQACPDADILSWRVVQSDGVIVESDLVDALTKIAELVRRYAAGDEGGQPIDVLSLSMGYYHETPEDVLFDPVMFDLLEMMGESGTTVVASAGNDATSRPMYPAAFAPWSDGGGVPTRSDCLPVLSVGALNPDDSTALFSNAGPWVRTYRPGGAVVSTIPPFQGGYEPIARTTAFGQQRESIDPDDFTGGFAVWSGTSFAAPLLAGRIATQLLPSLPGEDHEDTPAEAVARGWKAVEAVTGITAS
jgi:serine protease